jgi:hypothetical protein
MGYNIRSLEMRRCRAHFGIEAVLETQQFLQSTGFSILKPNVAWQVSFIMHLNKFTVIYLILHTFQRIWFRLGMTEPERVVANLA